LAAEPDPVDAAVQGLLRARSSGSPADDQAFQGRITSEEQAYAVQDRLLQALGDASACPRYWKSGAPSRAEQLRHAPLPAAGVRPAGASLGDLGLGRCWIEAEVALRIRREVKPGEARQLALEDASALVDGMCVSIEVLGSRWAAARNAAPLLKLADLLMHGALVLGDFVPFLPRAWDQQECRVRIGEADWRSFRGSLGLRDPAWVLPVWMRHASRNGAAIAAGTVVSTGTWCGMLEAQAGDRVAVEFPGIGAASAQLGR
jgi:2-keto-4-pentenoate hydratase